MSTTSPKPSPQDNVKPADYKDVFAARQAYTQHTDPCEQAAKASLSCMDRNDYNRDNCMDFFQAYRDCKKAWLEQRREDRRAGRSTPT
ncbi:uncharacterized protein EDB91DRAFT_1118094 [Suillus paluster]|uniref:uncharacterized protein n=1 Tax=Suillus paluster TaxID=48578 RepID=UPI001B86DC77|nr:uncharacterized protein EDB91DRAFT_1118094 [Suillus paluster]KAG1746635.1 hypothetical protein EDB91DRAFT_1118094 [Suillus paluster]